MSATDSIFYNDSEFCHRLTLVGSCTLPRPTLYGHVPSGEVHPDVIPHPKIPGQYLMVWTPYPSDIQEATEFPCIAQSTDKLNWSLVNGADVPLIPNWADTWNADPNIIYVDDLDRYYLYYAIDSNERSCKIAVSQEGTPHHFHTLIQYPYKPSWGLCSRAPSVLRDKVHNRFIMYYDGKEEIFGSDFPGAKYSIGRVILPDGLHYDGNIDTTPVVQVDSNSEPPLGQVWHISVRFFDGAYYMIGPVNQKNGACEAADIWAWKSPDGLVWTTIGKILDYTTLPVSDGKPPETGYRCSMIFENNTLFVYVSYNIRLDSVWSCRIALYKTELSTAGKKALKYRPTDFEQGGKVITSGIRDYSIKTGPYGQVPKW